jgi:hypothetical protein
MLLRRFHRFMHRISLIGVVLFPILLASSNAAAGAREDAVQIYNRLNGVPPNSATIERMVAAIEAGGLKDAAAIAIEDPGFYNVALPVWIAPWTNEDENPNIAMNDFTATVIGIIRDSIPFDQVLYGNIIYTAADALVSAQTNPIPAYATDSNAHYQALTDRSLDLKQNLVQKVQSDVVGIQETAGIMTTRAFAEAFFSGGTNRAPLRFTLKNFLCRDLEQLSDTSIADFRIRRDVDRSPGGDSKVFRSKCAGCHAGMDGLAGAFAYYDFVDDTLVYDSSKVQPKVLVNANTFPDGYANQDDGWINLWNRGQNAALGWHGQTEGKGAKELGEMLTQTDAFAACMSERVFEKLCLSKPRSEADREMVQKNAETFAANNSFNMKQLFIDTSVNCINR